MWRLRCLMWWDFLETSRHPWSLCVRMYHKFFPQIRMNCFQRNCLPLESLHADQCRVTQQSSGKGSGANEGQIYVHHSGDLSCFAYGDGCAATSKLSHNVRLNRCAITSFSLWKLKLCKVCTALTSLLSLTFNVATARLLLHAAQITQKVSIFMSHARGIMYCIWIWIFKLWHCQVLNGTKVHALMGSLSGINYVFMYGRPGRYKCLH